jgi:hypothetical protein
VRIGIATTEEEILTGTIDGTIVGGLAPENVALGPESAGLPNPLLLHVQLQNRSQHLHLRMKK